MSQTSQNYCETLRKSRLVDPTRLNEIIEEIEQATGTKIGARRLSKQLLDEELITPWQHGKLCEGHSEGFFLGKYKLLDHLGTGGMGSVFLAEHCRMRRRGAIKILTPELTKNPNLLARFDQEARATAALDHRNIVRAHDVDEEFGIHFLVMEYVNGADLQQRVQSDGPLPIHDVAELIRQAADGLAYAHDQTMVHRDIKPSNLLVDTEGVVKILDMGLARLLNEGDEESITLAGHDEVLGTVDFLAPEQLEDPHNVDPRVDLYSLGCTMFYLLTGKAPFDEGSMSDRLMAHQIQEPPNICELRPEVPEDLAGIVYKLMAKRPDDRYPTAAALRDELAQWLNPTPVAEAPPAQPTPQPQPSTPAPPAPQAQSAPAPTPAAPPPAAPEQTTSNPAAAPPAQAEAVVEQQPTPAAPAPAAEVQQAPHKIAPQEAPAPQSQQADSQTPDAAALQGAVDTTTKSSPAPQNVSVGTMIVLALLSLGFGLVVLLVLNGF